MNNDKYAAKDGKHYWNGWTNNYRVSRDGYCNHAWCEEDSKKGKALCGVKLMEGGGMGIPHELDHPSCLKCRRTMIKRGAISGEKVERKDDDEKR